MTYSQTLIEKLRKNEKINLQKNFQTKKVSELIKFKPDKFRPGCELDQISYMPGCELDQKSYRLGCELDQVSYRPGCELDQKSYRLGCELDQVSYRPGCELDQKSYRLGCELDQICYRPGCELDQKSNRHGCELRSDKLQAVLRFRLHKLQAMEPIHIFYKEPPADENNIFTANVAEENEVEGVRFKKSKEYAITGLSINQDVDSIAALDTDRQEATCNLIQKLVKEK